VRNIGLPSDTLLGVVSICGHERLELLEEFARTERDFNAPLN